MTSYIQRLVEAAAAVPRSADMAEPPTFITRSPVFEADQRLRIFTDIVMDLESVASDQPTAAPGNQRTRAQTDQAPVEPPGPKGEMEAGASGSKAADIALSDKYDQRSTITPNDDKTIATPNNAVSSLQRLVESDPLPKDFDFLNFSVSPSKTDAQRQERPDSRSIDRMQTSGEPADAALPQENPDLKSQQQLLRDPPSKSTADSFLVNESGLHPRSESTVMPVPQVDSRLISEFVPRKAGDPKTSISNRSSTANEPDSSSPAPPITNTQSAESAAPSIPMSVLESTSAVMHPPRLPAVEPTKQGRETQPGETASEFETGVEKRIVQSSPTPTQPRTAAEASVIGPLQRHALNSWLLRLRRF